MGSVIVFRADTANMGQAAPMRYHHVTPPMAVDSVGP